MSTSSSSTTVRQASEATRQRVTWRTGCPCGCSEPGECLAGRPIPRLAFCPCSTLGIDTLRRPVAVRWHLAGHPGDGVGCGMTRPFVVVRVESRWAAFVSGHGSWGLCRDAGNRKPVWSRTERAWVVSEHTAHRVVELAERADMGVVVTGVQGHDDHGVQGHRDDDRLADGLLW
jgi:hypothetical protein